MMQVPVLSALATGGFSTILSTPVVLSVPEVLAASLVLAAPLVLAELENVIIYVVLS